MKMLASIICRAHVVGDVQPRDRNAVIAQSGCCSARDHDMRVDPRISDTCARTCKRTMVRAYDRLSRRHVRAWLDFAFIILPSPSMAMVLAPLKAWPIRWASAAKRC